MGCLTTFGTSFGPPGTPGESARMGRTPLPKKCLDTWVGMVKSTPLQAVKLSAEEQARNLELRATETKRKHHRKQVVTCMDRHPSCVTELVNKLKSMGHIKDDGSIEEAVDAPKSLKQQAADNRRKTFKQSEKATPPPRAATEAYQEDVLTGDQIPYHRLDAASVKFMGEQILEKLEPSTLSMPNINNKICTRGKAADNKLVLRRIVEFGTGDDHDTPFTGNMAFVNFMQKDSVEHHEARGRRLRDLRFPIDWVRDGLVEIDSFTKTSINLKHRFTEQMVSINFSELPPFRRTSDIFIDYNRSETRMAIASVVDPEKKRSKLLVPKQCPAPRIPFGALVWYLPVANHPHKARPAFDQPVARKGLFLGYFVHPGGQVERRFSHCRS